MSPIAINVIIVNMNYYDISPKVSEKTAVFPGDVTFSRKVSMSFQNSDHLELSSVQTTLHVGSHADAPSHYHSKGLSIDQVDVKRYLGRCQVVRVKALEGERILPLHLKDESIRASRVLFATGSYSNPNEWNPNFNSLSYELIEDLAGKGVELVGIDTPSVDPHDSKSLECHQAIFEKDMSILEGLVLDDVPTGLYQLIALPLKLENAEASPVRAILLPLNWEISKH